VNAAGQDENLRHADLVLVSVDGGDIVDDGSWVYVWLLADGRQGVLYVGATGIPLQARVWLHLNHHDPEVGRIRALIPGAADARFDVIALRLAPDVPRADVKAVVIARLAHERLLSDSYVGPDPEPLDAPKEWMETANILVSAVASRVNEARS
jgi:hypothetical protein